MLPPSLVDVLRHVTAWSGGDDEAANYIASMRVDRRTSIQSTAGVCRYLVPTRGLIVRSLVLGIYCRSRKFSDVSVWKNLKFDASRSRRVNFNHENSMTKMVPCTSVAVNDSDKISWLCWGTLRQWPKVSPPSFSKYRYIWGSKSRDSDSGHRVRIFLFVHWLAGTLVAGPMAT